MTATAENNDPTSIFSTFNQGRVAEYIKLKNVASQEVLQSLANRAVTESRISNDKIRFTTGANVEHQPFSIISLKKNEFSGVISELEWNLTLGVEFIMTHVGRRITYA